MPHILLDLTPLFGAAPTGTFSAWLWMGQAILTQNQAMVTKQALRADPIPTGICGSFTPDLIVEESGPYL